MIPTSEGQFSPKPEEDCCSVRVWAEAVDLEWISLKMSGHDELRDVNSYVYLEPEDALNLAEDLRRSVEQQKRWQQRSERASGFESAMLRDRIELETDRD